MSPYRWCWAVDAPVIGSSIGLGVSAIFIDRNKTLLSGTYYPGSQIWKPERWAVQPYRSRVSLASDILMGTSLALPSLLLIDKRSRNDWRTYALGAETMIITIGITQLVKAVTARKRPYVYDGGGTSTYDIQQPGALHSFFSGHTSTSAAATFFFAKTYTDHHPNSRWKPWVWTAAAVLPATTGILRIAAGKHFPTDVLVGYVVGAGIGYLVPHLHRVRPKPVIPTSGL